MCLHPQPRILAARERYIEKLRRGNWTGARKELAVWSSEVATSVTRDRQLKVNVLSRRTAEQRRRLESRFPGVYAAPWKPRSRWGTQRSAKP